MLGNKIQTLLEVKWESRSLFLFDTVILGLLSIFTKSQASSHFEALNAAQLSKSSHKMNRCMNPCGEPGEIPRCPPHVDRVLTSLDTSRGTQSSVLQEVTMPDSSRKLIGIPI